MYNLKIIILLILFFPQVTSAQTIEGKVTDIEGVALELANVVFLDTHMDFVTGVTTSKDGIFTINKTKDNTKAYLVTSFVGMRSDTLMIDSKTRMPIDIVLHADEHIIGEVVIKGVRQLFKNENDVITANVENTILAKSGSLDKLMNQIPFISGSGGKYNVFGRGDATVYLNNRKVYDENILKTLNSDRIKKVKVITNPDSRYPADVKSVVKIYTIDNPDGLGGNAYTNLTTGRRFSSNEGVSVVYNIGRLQLSAGAGLADYNSRIFCKDKTSIKSKPQKLYTNDVKLDYDMTFINGNFGILYELSPQQSIGFNTKVTQYRHNHDINIKGINHYTNGINDFHATGKNTSKNTPTQWVTNLFYTLSAGKTYIDISNDFMLGEQHKKMNYVEDSNSEVSTNSRPKYLMNSFTINFNTPISSKVSVNYGGELTYSRHKQRFYFNEKDISTEMKDSKSKSKQLLGAVFTNLNASFEKFSIKAGVRYEYADWRYYEAEMINKSQSRVYNNLFPSVNISFNPNENTNMSLGYRQSILRPNYGQLNDNIEYQSRYYYVQGNSMLEPSFTKSINLLATYKNIRFIGSVDFIKDDLAMPRTIYGKKGDIVFSKVANISEYRRWNAGINWWQGFGVYTPYLELGIGGQDFSYSYMEGTRHFNHPFVNFKVHNTLNLKNNFSIKVFVDYYGKNNSLFKENTEIWQTELSVSKNIGQFFLQLSLNNMFCPRTRTSTTYCNRIIDSSYNNNDNRNLSFLVSYVFNYKQKKHNLNIKTSEIYRF